MGLIRMESMLNKRLQRRESIRSAFVKITSGRMQFEAAATEIPHRLYFMMRAFVANTQRPIKPMMRLPDSSVYRVISSWAN